MPIEKVVNDIEFNGYEEELIKLQNESLSQLEFQGVLNKIAGMCFSESGRERILDLKPAKNTEHTKFILDCIEEMYSLRAEGENIPNEGFTEIRQFLNKSLIDNSILSPVEILKVSDCIRSFRLIKKFFQEREELYPKLSSLSSQITYDRLLEKHISDAIDDTGNVKDTATRELAHIRSSIAEKSGRLRKRLEKILRKVTEDNLVQEDFYSLREGRFVLPVKAENKRVIPGIIHGISQTGSTVFLEPSEIIEMNNELSLLHNEEHREITKILMNLTQEIGAQAYEFLHSFDILSELDSIIARAKYAYNYGGEKPIISEDNQIDIFQVRHPLLMHTKGREKVIPLSIVFQENKRGYLISGPNAGGKTVALKSIGLAISMALSGIFPLGKCKTNYREVFTYIGDNQSIESDLSTFSSQMVKLKRIIENCSDRALILVDEIGSGTDPQEGAAIACGILDTFIEFKSFFIATTHQSSLKTYALSKDVIANASLEFNEDELKPTYKFLQDIPGNSYAFFLSKSIGMNEMVLKRSRKYLGNKQKELEKSINILQKYRIEAVQKRAEAEKEKIAAEQNRRSYEEKLEGIKQKRKEMVDDARAEALEIVEKANSLIENTIKEIKEEKRKVSEIKQDYSIIRDQLKNKVENSIKRDQKDNAIKENIEVGDSVSMIDSDSLGIVKELDEKTNTAMVDFHGMNFKVKLNKLKLNSKEKKEIVKSSETYAKFDVSNKIDLRGKRAEEALVDLDEFLSDAILGNIDSLTIVHGKGTGALRVAIHDYLRHHQSVKKFRLGELVEGGAGATIVEI